jgi:AcrR family transcriptional regulator
MDKRLNRQRWLSAGLETLATIGPEGLRIMPIAEQLGVTKGSFYWHFKNMDDYQQALLAEWENLYTQEAIRWIEGEASEPQAKLKNWITGAAYADFRLDRAIRSWAQANPAAQEIRTRVDQDRIAYLAKLLRGVGWSKEEAASLADWTYCAWVGYTMMDLPPSTDKQLRLILSRLNPGN